MRVMLSPDSVPARFERRVDATLPPRAAAAITRSDEVGDSSRQRGMRATTAFV
ncbi:hypothetical protein [Burkholderia metallica]|uniref:hypothetical protein n=1 Tax=Burkholderia metallica TaxID=488729 RepID=UPI00158D55AB|nr:hypothetical protein [Burkholderia metallica]